MSESRAEGAAGTSTALVPDDEEQRTCFKQCVSSCPPPVRAMCASNRFDNLHVEMLYQRYFLRMNQTNMTHLLGLLLTVAVGLMVVQVRTLLLAQNFLGELIPFPFVLSSTEPNLEPLEFFTQYPRSGTLSDSQSFDDTDPSHYKRIYYEKERVAHIINVIVLGLSALVFACLLACLSRPAMNEIYLLTISYVVLVAFLLIEFSFAGTSVLRSLTVSTGACSLFTYVTYATLPVRLHEATIGGLALAAVNIGAHLLLDNSSDMQLYCTIATLIACNAAGMLTHQPRELAQRRAFLETRDCVEARLLTQRENQQQESAGPAAGAQARRNSYIPDE